MKGKLLLFEKFFQERITQIPERGKVNQVFRKNEKHFFWNTGSPEPYKSGSRMHQEGDLIIVEVEDFDTEDGVQYCYLGKFKVKDYQMALQALQKQEKSEIQGIEPNTTLKLTKKDDFVQLVFSGIPLPCTRVTHGTIHLEKRKIQELLL